MQTDGLSGPSFSLIVILLLLGLFMAGLLLFLLRRRYRLRQSVMLRRVWELEALGEAGRSLVEAQLDVRALSNLIAKEASKIIDTGTFQVGLFKDQRYEIMYWCLNGKRRDSATFDLEEDGGLIGWVRDNRQPLLVRDFEQERETLPARPRYVSDSPPRSGIFVPLLSGDQTLGILAAQSDAPDHFTRNDLRRLSILANQSASAIANARLYEDERTRAAHLELVGQIAQQVNAIQELDELFNQVVTLTRETFGFHPASIFGIDNVSGEAMIQASSLEGVEPGQIHVPPGLGLVGTAVATQQTIVSNYTLDDELFVQSFEGHPDYVTRAEIAIPLIVDEQLLGVLDVQSEEAGVFYAREQMVLEALAAQIASAIHKTRQLAAQREQAWVTTAQLQVADAIRESSNMDELLTALTRLTPLLVGVDYCGMLLWSDELQLYEGAAAYGLPASSTKRFLQAQLAIGDWSPLDAVHVGMARLQTDKPAPWLERLHEEGATVLYPLVAKGQMVGVMVVDEPSHPPVAIKGYVSENFFERQDELLRNVANQAAQAVESEQLHIAQQEEAWVNTALLQVAEAVNSLIDLNEILNTIVRFVPLLVGVDSCIILVWDEASNTFRAGPSYGIDEMGRGLIESFEIGAHELPHMEAPDFASPVPGATLFKIRLPNWLHDVLATPVAEVLPLYARSSLVGALLVGPTSNDRPLAGRRLNILTGIAQQAAIAVVNDQLYSEAAERNRLEQELDVARQIQASFIPPGNPQIPFCDVASFWQAARQVSGDFYDFLELPNERWGVVIADVADKGVPAALFMALSRTIIRTIALSRYEPAAALERANRIIWNDTTSDLFVTAFYAIWDPSTRTLAYGNAGHNPPLLIRADGDSEELRGEGVAMGVLEQVRIGQKYVRLQPGDTVVFYTDGVTEAMNEDLDEFGMERLKLAASSAALRRVGAPSMGQAGRMPGGDAPPGSVPGSAKAVVHAVTAAIGDHTGATAQYDDVTLVVMKCVG
ncbi:MAG TPA: SpoIIE family protein phosphatase [Candidatus Binatia bacterium]|nr:SpoIIE family protein phosphatase [Candidatus Binatia bacterium]